MKAAIAVPSSKMFLGSGTENDTSSTKTTPLFVGPPEKVWIAYTMRALSAPAGTTADTVNGAYWCVGTGMELGTRETSMFVNEFRHSMRTPTSKPSGVLIVRCHPGK